MNLMSANGRQQLHRLCVKLIMRRKDKETEFTWLPVKAHYEHSS